MIHISLSFLKVEKVAFPSHQGLVYLICASDLMTPKLLAVTVLNLNYEYNAGVQCSNYSFILSKWRTDELICDPI